MFAYNLKVCLNEVLIVNCLFKKKNLCDHFLFKRECSSTQVYIVTYFKLLTLISVPSITCNPLEGGNLFHTLVLLLWFVWITSQFELYSLSPPHCSSSAEGEDEEMDDVDLEEEEDIIEDMEMMGHLHSGSSSTFSSGVWRSRHPIVASCQADP